MSRVQLTDKQSKHCLRILNEMCRVANERRTLPPMWSIRLSLTRDMIEDEIAFGDDDFKFLSVMLLCYLSVLEPDDIDPLAEAAYCKCAGYWAIVPPYYDRIRAMSTERQEPPIGT